MSLSVYESDTERCTIQFMDGGRLMKARWERTRDGAEWQTFCETTATRVQ